MRRLIPLSDLTSQYGINAHLLTNLLSRLNFFREVYFIYIFIVKFRSQISDGFAYNSFCSNSLYYILFVYVMQVLGLIF